MHYLFGLEYNLETLYLLTAPFIGQDKSLTKDTFKRAYQRLTKSFQPLLPLSEYQAINFVADEVSLKIIESLFDFTGLANESTQNIPNLVDSARETRYDTLARLRSVLEGLSRLDPKLHQALNLWINEVFTTESKIPGSQTTNGAIGVVLINPALTWNFQDIAEAFVHELTHTLLFLDEYRFQHYLDYDALRTEYPTIRTAIHKQVQPLNIVFHSIVVASELLTLRERIFGQTQAPKFHPQSSVIIESLSEAIEAVLTFPNIDQLLTGRALSILNEVKTAFQHQCTFSKC